MENSKIIKKIAKNIASVPGFQNFSNLLDDEEINFSDDQDFSKAFVINEGSRGLKIKMAIILLLNARTKILINQIREETINVLKKEGLKLESLDIFVQGVK